MKFILSCLLVCTAMIVLAADANAYVCARRLSGGMRGAARRSGCASSGGGLRVGERQTRLDRKSVV